MRDLSIIRLSLISTLVIVGTALVAPLFLRQASTVAAQSACIQPPPGLVSWWTGDGDANDIQGSNSGTLQNGVSFAPGKVGQAFSLDGVDDYVQIPHYAGLDPGTSSFTLDAWVKTTQAIGLQIVASKYECGQTCISEVTNSVYYLGVIDGRPGAFIRDTDKGGTASASEGQGLNGPTFIADGNFHHLTMVRDITAGEFHLYVDGALDASAPLNAGATGDIRDEDGEPDPFLIGAVIRGGASIREYFFSGLIDEVEYFNRALSASEIQSIFNAGSAGKCLPGSNNSPVAICQNVTVPAGANCAADASIDNGSFDPDGDSITITQSPAGPYPLGDILVTLTVTDSKGAMSQCSATVTVTNPSPTVMITGPPTGSVYPVDTPVYFTGMFNDSAGGVHTAIWSFDGITKAGTVDETTGAITASYSFAMAGVYQVSLTVNDGCSGTATTNTIDGMTALIVIYDPIAGFVTGGGWINSPAGAYVPNPSLTGKANFGFVSKYHNGATVPSGNTEFQFKAGNLYFSSTSYEWLVIAGARAQYKGSGKINGAGSYDFMLTAIDGQQPGGSGVDKFRIRIWDRVSGGLIYDNQLNAPNSNDPTTVLGGGNIVIHK